MNQANDKVTIGSERTPGKPTSRNASEIANEMTHRSASLPGLS